MVHSIVILNARLNIEANATHYTSCVYNASDRFLDPVLLNSPRASSTVCAGTATKPNGFATVDHVATGEPSPEIPTALTLGVA